MFKVSGVSLRIESKLILNNIDLQLTPGTFMAVVGPNGAGKSSLLKVMSRELDPFEGEVTINERVVKAYSPHELSAVRAVLAQDTHVQFNFSVDDVVMLGRHCHRTTRDINRDVVDEVLSLTNTSYLRGRTYSSLSGGEKQRVQFARVVSQVWENKGVPRYILLDEPISSLDIAQQQTILDLARKVCRRNIGVLAIIHDLNMAAQYADEMYFLRDGKCLAAGLTRDIFTKDSIEDTFRCRVNLYDDSVGKCPFIIPRRVWDETSILAPVSEETEA
jgi:iron complex transport system ATP-binding protein